MSRPASPARAALRDALAAGFSGTYAALADLAGVKPQTARATLKELSRDRKACASERKRVAGRSGASPAVYAAYQQPFDALGFVHQVWR